MTFTFVDLFAGIGGFHAALSRMGGECVLASEIDRSARDVYERNWGLQPVGDIYEFVSDRSVRLPAASVRVDVLTAGFPCQPFSKSGKQLGMNEPRGTLFDAIMTFVRKRKPAVVVLENVRNLAGPRHRHEFDHVIRSLREAGYQVTSNPVVLSPHRIRPEFGGRPQVRERIFITATRSSRRSHLDPGPIQLPNEILIDNVKSWDVRKFLEDVPSPESQISKAEEEWINAWEKFVQMIRSEGVERLPGHPLWSDTWIKTENRRNQERERNSQLEGLPRWKQSFLSSNWKFYDEHSRVIDYWRDESGISSFPKSRRKLEWQAQDAESIWDCAIHLRPSGVRVKQLTYLPAFVAMNQTSIIGPERRRLMPSEAAVLQGLPADFDFGSQPISESFKQLGNGVNVGVVWQVIRSHVSRDRELLQRSAPHLVKALESLPESPDIAIETV